MEIVKRHIWLASIIVISLSIFFPAFSTFYTNDDFFHLTISRAHSVGDYVGFLNILDLPGGYAFYRPLTTQFFYSLSWNFFNLNPTGLHIISFAFFAGIIILIYLLTSELTGSKKISLLSSFLYGVSHTHFGHLYYLSAFQELGVTFFVLLSIYSFLKNRKFISFLAFLAALLSKETAATTPLLIGLCLYYKNIKGNTDLGLRKTLSVLSPFFITLLIYLILRYQFIGHVQGDSYIWDFSIKKLINTFGWYLLWSLNIPETFLDFIGPGLKVNPNLLVYWPKETSTIFYLFVLEMLLLLGLFLRSVIVLNKKSAENNKLSIFSILWFSISILPVVFLPLHKFTFYLTLPLIGIVIRVAYLITQTPRQVIIPVFCLTWLLLNMMSIKHTKNTSWITKGQDVAYKTYEFIKNNRTDISDKNILFVDTANDLTLPWSPTVIVRNAISGDNMFRIYFPEMEGRVFFGKNGDIDPSKSYIIISRSLLGY